VFNLPPKMTTFREKINSHLPIVLQLLSTASLVVIALSAVCGSQSLKRLSSSYEMPISAEVHQNK
tara:strand:+ start:1523 stop:1717 length:195 start_codon:yes stop_codon:yes gene_type:complete